jgi:aldose 1-epimerase
VADYSARESAQDGIDIVRLSDARRRIEVSIVPSIGNNAFDVRVAGKPVFWSPYASLADFRAKPVFLGNPFLAPWANRLDQEAFFANGKRYVLNASLGNYRYDPHHLPIHGLLSYSSYWEVASMGAHEAGAWLASRLEFWRYPELMAQFPFAHTIEMTYGLAGGTMEVRTRIANESREPLPLGIGYHPYFTLAEAPRDEWKVHVAAREHVLLSDLLIPTGEREPVTLPDPVSLAGSHLDDVFTNLIRDDDGRAEFWVRGGGRQISVIYGPKYPVAVIYAPPGKDFICFEPMTAVTNAFNLAHAGRYDGLQSIPAGGEWQESFWIRPQGFD